MAKLISVSDDVYETLTKIKDKEESYSKVIRKLIAKDTNKDVILSFYGKGGVDAKKLKELKVYWKKWSEKYV